MPVMRSGSGTGKIARSNEFFVLGSGMKRAAASCAWPALPMMVR